MESRKSDLITRRTALLLLAALPLLAGETALDRYVKTPDPHYKHEVVKTIPGKGYTAYVVELTSPGVEALADDREAGQGGTLDGLPLYIRREQSR
jgi:hypothetical protein